MDVRTVLQNLSVAANYQVANQIITNNGNGNLANHFASWIGNHTIAKEDIPYFLQAVSRVGQLEQGSNLSAVDSAVQKLFQKEFNIENRNHLQEALALFPVEQQSIVLPDLLSLYVGINWADECKIAQMLLSDIQSEERVSLLQNSALLLKNVEAGDQRAEILFAIHDISKEERASIVSMVAPFFTDSIKTRGFDRDVILSAMVLIPSENRAAALPSLIRLLKGMEKKSDCIIGAITRISKNERGSLIQQVAPYVNENTKNRQELVRAVAQIPETGRGSVLTQAAPLMAGIHEGHQIGYMVTTIASIPEGERVSIIQTASPLMQYVSDGYAKAYIIKEIQSTPKEERELILSYAIPLMIGISGGANILTVIKKIPQNDRASVVTFAVYLFCGWNMAEVAYQKGFSIDLNKILNSPKSDFGDSLERGKILEAIAAIPENKRFSPLVSSAQLIKSKKITKEREKILQAIVAMPEEERASIISEAGRLLLMRNISEGDHWAKILRAVAAIPKEDRESVRKYALPFIKDVFNVDYESEILKALAAIPKADRTSVCNHTQALMIDNSREQKNRAEVLQAMAAIPEADRPSVVSYTKRLRASRERDTKMILEEMAKIPIGKRESVVSDAVRLIEIRNFENNDQRAEILRIIAMFPEQGRDAILRDIIIVMKSDLDSRKEHLLQVLALIPFEERVAALPTFLPLIKYVDNEDERVHILQAIANISSQKRNTVLTFVAPLIGSQTDGFAREALLELVNLIPFQQIQGVVPAIISTIQEFSNFLNKRHWFTIFKTALSTLVADRRGPALLYFLDLMFNSSQSFADQISAMQERFTSDFVEEVSPLEIVRAQVLYKGSFEATLDIPDLSHISLTPLISYLDATHLDLRNSLQELIIRIIDREPYQGVPSEEVTRLEWYQNLHNILAATLLLVQDSERAGTLDRHNLTTELTIVANSKRECGAAWRNSAINFYHVMTESIEVAEIGGLENQVLLWLGRYKEGVINELLRAFQHFVGNSSIPHLYNHIVKTLLERGVKFSGNTLFQYDPHDPLITLERTISTNTIVQRFESHFTPQKVFTYLASRALETENRDLVYEELKALAEGQLTDQFLQIDQQLDSLKVECGRAVREEQIGEANLKIAILEGGNFERTINNQMVEQRLLADLNEFEDQDQRRRELLEDEQEKIDHLTNLPNEELKNLGSIKAIETIQNQKQEHRIQFLQEKGFLNEYENTLLGVTELLIQKGFFKRVE